jgi:hypothetical protein
LAAVAAAGAAVVMGAAPASALGPLHHQTVRLNVTGKVVALSIRGEVGDIRIVAGTSTRVVAKESWNLTAPTLTHSLKGGVLRVAAPCPRGGGLEIDLGLNDCSVDFVVTVPRAVAVDAIDDVGDVTVRGLSGNESLRTDVGAVRVDHVTASSLTAVASAGSLRLRGLHVKSLSLRSSTGDIDAALAAKPRFVRARCSDGDVRLAVPSGVYAVDVRTAVGTAHVHGITVRSDAHRTLLARSADGDVSITGR